MSDWWWDVCLFDGLDRVGGGHTWDPTVIWLNLHQPHKVRWGNWFNRFLSIIVAGDVLRHWLAHHDIDNPSHTPFHRELTNQDTSVHSVSKGSSIFHHCMIINVIVIIMVFVESRPLWSFGQQGTLNSSAALTEMLLVDYHHPNLHLHPHCRYHNCVTRAPLLYFIRSWAALSFKVVSQWVSQASVTPVQISTLFNI